MGAASWKSGFATKREAQAFLTRVLASLGDGSYVQPSKVTLREYLVGEWLPAISGTVRPLTLTQYTSIAKSRIVPRIGHLRLQALSGGHLTRSIASSRRRASRPRRAGSRMPCSTGRSVTPSAGGS